MTAFDWASLLHWRSYRLWLSNLIPFIDPPDPTLHPVLIKYRNVLCRSKSALLTLLWGENTPESRQVLLDAAAKVDKMIAQDRDFNRVINAGGRLEDISAAIEAVLIDRAVSW
jgi:hypothetical protein